MLNAFMSCFPRYCLECVQGPSFTDSVNYNRLKEQPSVRLNVNKMGSDVVILKDGERICGTGAALGTAPIVQNKAYFQVNVQQTGAWQVGVASSDANLNDTPPTRDFWGMNERGELVAGGDVVEKVEQIVDEGDSIGVTYDHIELKFYINGEAVGNPITNVRGKVFPCIFVDDSAILDVKFKSFSYPPPHDFGEILFEQTLL